jgi:peptidoglycan/xylan/chitin deacetylase (PgdA/CDA1 family)
MFFELSQEKLSFLGAVTVALLSAVLLFGIANAAWRLVPRGSEALALAGGRAAYFFEFKLPSLGPGLLAAAAGADASSTGAATGGDAVGVPVLLYHGEGGDTTAMPTATFVAQMRALYDAGWRTITYQQFSDFIKDGTPVPAKSFLLTFDDGRRDTYYAVDPVLEDLHYTAVMFVITGFSMPDNGANPTNGFYLSKDQLAAMVQSGRWELESHGEMDHAEYDVPSATSTPDTPSFIPESHFLSNRFWLPDENRLETTSEYTARVTGDLADSKNTLESDFGISVTGFAYPFNDFGEDTVNFPDSESILGGVVPRIYDFAFYQTWPGNGDTFNYPDPDAYLIKRIEPLSSWSGDKLLSVLGGGAAKSLPYASAGFGDDWETNWGTMTPGATLALAADKDSTGAAAFLDGTQSWTDYRVSAQVTGNNGTVSLAARYAGSAAPYLVCAFSNDTIYLERHSGEAQSTIAKARYAPPANGDLSVSMSVDGKAASCGAYGVTVSGSAGGIRAGGIGVLTWDPEPGTARTTVTSMDAAPFPS